MHWFAQRQQAAGMKTWAHMGVEGALLLCVCACRLVSHLLILETLCPSISDWTKIVCRHWVCYKDSKYLLGKPQIVSNTHIHTHTHTHTERERERERERPCFLFHPMDEGSVILVIFYKTSKYPDLKTKNISEEIIFLRHIKLPSIEFTLYMHRNTPEHKRI